MKSLQENSEIIRNHADEIRNKFGVKSLCIFGSVARNEQTPHSDVDICVDMAPKMMLVIRLKRYLENILNCSVDLIRLHKNMNLFLKQQIDRDGIYILQ